MIKKLFSEMKSIFFYFFSAVLVLDIAYIIVAMIIMANSIHSYQTEIINHELVITEIEKSMVSSKINNMVTDAFYIADLLKLDNVENGDYTCIENQWIAFMNRKKIYAEIRYIDKKGIELLQINYSTDGSYRVVQSELSDKSDQHYFQRAIGLSDGQVFLSEYGVSNESGSEKLKTEPTILIATPCYSEMGKLEGVVILNYKASDMIEQVRTVASTSYGSVYIINSDGYWIGNSKNRGKEWTFLYKDRENDNFQADYPKEWEIMKGVQDSFVNTENGLFTWSNVLTSKEFIIANASNEIVMDDREWYIATHIPSDSYEWKIFSLGFIEKITYIVQNDKLSFILILLVALIFGIQMTLSKIKRDKIRYFSEYDTLTDVYNRRAAFEKFEKLYRDSSKDKGIISVCFIDINGLKLVNDYLGHEAGDELILTVVRCFKRNTRGTDIIARLGGDEFLIIFNNTYASAAEDVWKRISREFETINQREDRKYIISASHGIEEFKIDSKDSIEDIINHADEKMYSEKRAMKNEINVLRDFKNEDLE